MVNSYKQAGVDIEAGYEAVLRMKKHVKKTLRPEVLGGLGGFGGMFDLSKLNVSEPVLVSGTDGVGTKLMLAFMLDKHDTIGIDVVAMCVNDIVVQGAEPLFFLDYVACGKAIPEKIEAIVSGVAVGCEMAGCALIGGETAEMPGMYQDDEYDLAGFTVGVVEKSKLITGQNIKAGDILIGLASNGQLTNGFSLVRKVLLHDHVLDLDKCYGNMARPLGVELLQPTRIYVKPILELLKKADVKGMAHITGGGFIENIPRMLPAGLGAEIELDSWSIPPIFELIQEKGQLQQSDMFNVFNMGIGLVLAVEQEKADEVVKVLTDLGEKASVIGVVREGSGITFCEGIKG